MKKELRFKVKYGYGAMDKVSIGIKDLEKALYAQRYEIPALLGGKQIRGQEIKVIEPDYHYYTGWYDSYEPSDADDFAQIKRDCPPELLQTITDTREKIDYLIKTNQKHLIGEGVEIKQLEKPEVGRLPELSKEIADKFNINK